MSRRLYAALMLVSAALATSPGSIFPSNSNLTDLAEAPAKCTPREEAKYSSTECAKLTTGLVRVTKQSDGSIFKTMRARLYRKSVGKNVIFEHAFESGVMCTSHFNTCEKRREVMAGDEDGAMADCRTRTTSLNAVDVEYNKTLVPRECSSKEKKAVEDECGGQNAKLEAVKEKADCSKKAKNCQAYTVSKKCGLKWEDDFDKVEKKAWSDGGLKQECLGL